jgi:glycosyltransferase involved in cell wall biosynthesis
LDNEDQLKIAYVHPWPAEAGFEEEGAETIYRDRFFCSMLQSFGHAVRCLRTTRGALPVTVEVDDLLCYEYLPLDAAFRGARGRDATSALLTHVVDDWCPDVLVVKGADSEIGRLLRKQVSPQVFATIIGGGYRSIDVLKSDLVLTENSEQFDYLVPVMGSNHVIHLPKLAGASITSTVKREPPRFDFVVVSKFVRHKNHRALNSLFDEDVAIAFLGDGELRAEVEDMADGRRARAVFFGYVDSARVAEVVASSRILVHPSLSEGFPRAVVEAMALGVPAVCVAGVVGDPVVDGYNGRLVAPGCFAGSCMELVRDESELNRLGSAARGTYEAVFSEDALSSAAKEFDRRLHDHRTSGLASCQAVSSRRSLSD